MLFYEPFDIFACFNVCNNGFDILNRIKRVFEYLKTVKAVFNA